MPCVGGNAWIVAVPGALRIPAPNVFKQCLARSDLGEGVPSFLLPKVTEGFGDNHRAGGGFL
jgi:hypothetical protein